MMWRKLHEVGLGLLFLHELTIVHSDVKSNNILVSTNGVAMLNDFGLSFDQTEPRPTLLKEWGVIQWRPPEYVLDNADGPSFEGDVYSFGMCIIEAVARREAPWGPYRDDEVKEFLRNKEMMPKPPELSDPEWELVQRMCAFESSARMPLADVIPRLESLAKSEEERERANLPISSVTTSSSASHPPQRSATNLSESY